MSYDNLMTVALIMMRDGKQSKLSENSAQNPFSRLMYGKVTTMKTHEN